MKRIISALLLMTCVVICYAQNNKYDLHGKIFENPPDTIPKIFAKDIISVPDRFEYGLAISPNWDEMFFTAEDPGGGLMVMRKLEGGNWKAPVVANLRGNNSWEYEAFYTKDGNKLYFTSDVQDTARLWFSIKEKTKWLTPQLLKSPVNNTPVFWATFSSYNTMYYTNLSVFKIYCSKFIDDTYTKPYDIGLPFGVHPYVSADESFILFNGKGDLYITFKDNLNKWTEPVRLGNLISTSEYIETCLTLSPDEKFIFFSRYNDINNKSDIYWVSSRIIENIRKQVFK